MLDADLISETVFMPERNKIEGQKAPNLLVSYDELFRADQIIVADPEIHDIFDPAQSFGPQPYYQDVMITTIYHFLDEITKPYTHVTNRNTVVPEKDDAGRLVVARGRDGLLLFMFEFGDKEKFRRLSFDPDRLAMRLHNPDDRVLWGRALQISDQRALGPKRFKRLENLPIQH
ncbi:MAG: hypothetical protein K2P80_14495 [Beijerinckiaceae bacterium]|nr:hypothetical protein [Beijerinckiaceae bacterium]